MRILKSTGWLLLGLITLVVLLYLIAVVINWRDAPRSAAAIRLDQIIAGRPAIPPTDNAAIYVLGFTAPPGVDPADMGARRMAHLEGLAAGKYVAWKESDDPLHDPMSFEAGSKMVARVKDACAWDEDRKACAEAIDLAVQEFRPDATDLLALQRYEALLTRHTWRDVVPLDLRAPLPPYAGVLHAQRLYMVRLAQDIAAGKVDAVRDVLNADAAFWRAALPSADNLIGQMIVVAGLRNHFFYAQHVLRKLPQDQIESAIPADWSREFSIQERSMLRVMAGECAFQIRVLRDSRELLNDLGKPFERVQPPGMSARVVDRVTRPLFQFQATANLFAKDCLRLAEAFAVPIDQYQLAAASLPRAETNWSPYNLTGIYLYRSLENLGTPYVIYAVRAATPEAWRRAAVLTAKLRARGIAPDAVGAEIAASELRDPFTLAPFTWNAERRSITWAGPEAYPLHREEYFY